MRACSAVFGLCLLFAAPFSWADPAPSAPPGFNVHLVREKDGHMFWRGGAPRTDTVQALQASARARHTQVTVIDLRHPDNSDDRSGKGGRLAPTAEQKRAAALGWGYESVSALDPALVPKIDAALARGDVYIHCMYGVNRTGFATARYATADGLTLDRSGLGERDWAQGAAYEHAHPTKH